MQKGVGHQAHQLYLVHRVFLDSAGRRTCRPSMLAPEDRHPATKDDFDAHPCTVWATSARAHDARRSGPPCSTPTPARERLPDAGGVVRERLRIRAFASRCRRSPRGKSPGTRNRRRRRGGRIHPTSTFEQQSRRHHRQRSKACCSCWRTSRARRQSGPVSFCNVQCGVPCRLIIHNRQPVAP